MQIAVRVEHVQASQQDATPGKGSSTGAWLDSDSQKSKPHAEEEEDEEEDPFGLGAIMSKAEEGSEDEEEEDPFGLGAIMDKASGDTPNANGKRTSSGDQESRSSKAQKTTAPATTGGYFKGSQSSTSTQSAVAEAKRQPFRAAGSFGGARHGYVFQKGPLGLGYYADRVQLRAAAATEAVAALAASRSTSRGSQDRDARTVSIAGTAGGREGGGRKPQTVDVAASLLKLKGFLLKPKKAAKASSLLADLMEAQMRPENSRMFFRYGSKLPAEPPVDKSKRTSQLSLGAVVASCPAVSPPHLTGERYWQKPPTHQPSPTFRLLPRCVACPAVPQSAEASRRRASRRGSSCRWRRGETGIRVACEESVGVGSDAGGGGAGCNVGAAFRFAARGTIWKRGLTAIHSPWPRGKYFVGFTSRVTVWILGVVLFTGSQFSVAMPSSLGS